jgi:phosphate transport system substrate-binding protein
MICRWLSLAFSLFGVLTNTTLAPAQDNPTSRGSVEQLTAMLRTIDPYRPNSDVSGKVQVFGSTSMDALAHGWVTGFTQFHSRAKVEISAAGSEKAFSQLLSNPSSIAMLSRPVKPEELSELKQQGLKQPVAFVVAREALSVFVHATNPTSSISGEQLRMIFTTDSPTENLVWSALGATGAWATRPIHVISRSENSGTQMFLSDFVFEGANMRSGVSSHISNAEVLQALEKDPLAIAICGYRSSGNSVKQLQLMAGNRSIPSDDHAVLSGLYPLMRPLTLVLDMGQSDSNAKNSQEFVRYALCQAGQTQAILVGFFPVDPPLLRAGLQQLETSANQLR